MVNRLKRFSIFRKNEAKKDKDLLVAASVIAAMAYQAAISPPGGVAGADAQGSDPQLDPADSLLAHFYPHLSSVFWVANTISLMAALSVIFLYVTGTSLKRKFLIWVIRLAMWITLSSMTVAYACAVIAITPKTDFDETTGTVKALIIGVIAWVGLIFLSSFVLVFRFIRYIVRQFTKKSTVGDAVEEAVLDTTDHIV